MSVFIYAMSERFFVSHEILRSGNFCSGTFERDAMPLFGRYREEESGHNSDIIKTDTTMDPGATLSPP